MSKENCATNEEFDSIIQCKKCGEIINIDNTKIYNDLLLQNNTINNMLNELKNKIEDSNNLENIKDSIKSHINSIISENEKNKEKLKQKLAQDKQAELNNDSNEILKKFDIKLKEPIKKVKSHSSYIKSCTILKDGRIATGGYDRSIIIHNKETFEPDIIINEHEDDINYLLLLSSGYLASCSKDSKIKIFNISGNEYNVIQTLNHHIKGVNKLLELNNQKLVSCSNDQEHDHFAFSNRGYSIIFYTKSKEIDNNEYMMDFGIKSESQCTNIIQTKDNEIFYSEYNPSTLCFYDFAEKKIIAKINDIRAQCMEKITSDLLLVGGYNKLYLININIHNLIRIIDCSDSRFIYDICILSDNVVLTGDEESNIKQWRILGDKLILISEKKDSDLNNVKSLLKISDEHIISCDNSGFLKYW